ncbi:MAG: outer membrane protein assembly factor BamD [Bradymonadaceae bacterium]
MHIQHMRTLHLISVLLLVSLVAVTGCRTSSGDKPTTYSDMAEHTYFQGERSFEKKDYFKAMQSYNTVRNQFPYSRYAALADLRIADAYYAQEQYSSSIEQYRSFVRLYPRHEEVTYAYWRIANSFYEQMPSDWWLMPPAHERDLSRTREAVRELRLFLKHFPESEYAPEAQRKLAEVRQRIAEHEYYVAEFYLRNKNHKAVVGRLTYLLTHYAGLGFDREALLQLGKSYLEIGERERAITALEDLVQVHPNSEQAKEARRYLAQLAPAE